MLKTKIEALRRKREIEGCCFYITTKTTMYVIFFTIIELQTVMNVKNTPFVC